MLRILETHDGSHSLYSEQFGASYHSRFGALSESRHVFIEAGLFYKAIQKKQLHILEMGFGTGLNALLTYIEAELLGLQIHYTGIDAYPVPAELAVRLNYPSIVEGENREELFSRFHHISWGKPVSMSPFFTLEKRWQFFEDLTCKTQYDLVYFDAFAPAVQPELWAAPLLKEVFAALFTGGILVTYCAKGTFKRTLKETGFEVETLDGPPGKREMIRAKKPDTQ